MIFLFSMIVAVFRSPLVSHDKHKEDKGRKVSEIGGTRTRRVEKTWCCLLGEQSRIEVVLFTPVV